LTEVTDTYYSDRAGGPRPRALEHIDETLWAAILALLDRGIEGAWFAKDFRSPVKMPRAPTPATEKA